MICKKDIFIEGDYKIVCDCKERIWVSNYMEHLKSKRHLKHIKNFFKEIYSYYNINGE